jgi:hypothetical protein
VALLRFPADVAVGEVDWEDVREPGGWGHLLAIGVVEVPDGTAVSLSVYTVAEVSISDGRRGIFEAPDGTKSVLAVLAARLGQERERVTWHREMPDRALRNNRNIWDGESYSIERGQEPVDLEFIRALPADSVSSLSVGDVIPSSFGAVAHLAPGLRRLGVYLDNLGDDAPSVIAQLRALESLSLYGDSAMDEGRRLDDRALSMIADLPALEYLSLLDGAYTEDGLRQLARLPKLRHLHIEREGLTAPMFAFAADMPTLAMLTGLDEFGDDGPMPPVEVAKVRAMLPHISLGD